MSLPLATTETPMRPWRRAAAWLAFLAPFFYLTYGGANWLSSIRHDVPSIVFEWERHIPFLAWTIVPYWSINAFYGLSLFVCRTPREVDTLGRRLLTAQIIAVICFVLFPLRISFAKPETGGGLPGFLFDMLAGFDKPFNQAPSLHIALLVILWQFYTRYLPRWALAPAHLWSLLIGVSVLTTYQHHFLDIPTGALLGLFCLWLWPDNEKGLLVGGHFARDPKRRKLALVYTSGAVAFALIAAAIGGIGLWLFYPAVSLSLVAANYAFFGAKGFQKKPNGSISLASLLLFAPYRAAAWLNSRLWTRREPEPVTVTGTVFLGRLPSRFDPSAAHFTTIIDLAAELPSDDLASEVKAHPMLDLVAPPADILRAAAETIDQANACGAVLVCCALGYSRSAATLATWLIRSGHATSMEAAIAIIAKARPRIVLNSDARSAISAAACAP